MAAAPSAVRIDDMAVTAPLVPLGLTADGTLAVPGFDDAGWWAGGARPGDDGAAVVVAHVDSTTGPAPFFRLHELRPGAVVVIAYDDGSEVAFTVTAVERHPKERFPTEQVYGPTPDPELRLVTCGGFFDHTTGHYRDNVVVWADHAVLRPAPPPA